MTSDIFRPRAGLAFVCTQAIARRRAIAAASLLALAAAPVVAQAPLTQAPLSLAQVVEKAQLQGLQSHANLATLEAARQRDRSFGARLLPQLSLTGLTPNYNRSIISVMQPDGTTLFKPQQQTDGSLNLSLTQKLPFTGGDLVISSALSQLRRTGDASLETWSSTPYSISLRQNLLRPNTTRWDAREQDLRIDVAERQFLEAREDVATAATNAFFDVYAAKLALKNAAGNMAINDTLYTLNKGRFEVGKISENDLLQSELALLNARTSVDGARLTYERALASLRLLINLPTGAPIDVTVSAGVPAFEADTTIAERQARLNRSTTADLDLQELQAKRRVTEARLNTGIGAFVSAAYGRNATGATADAAYQNLLAAQRFSLSVQMPLVQWGAHSADVQAARADQERVTNTARVAREQAVQDAHFAALQLGLSRRQLELSAKADTVAQKRYEVTYNRYVIGRITIDILFLAQSDKDRALDAYTQALRGYWLSHYRLRRLTLFDFATGAAIR